MIFPGNGEAPIYAQASVNWDQIFELIAQSDHYTVNYILSKFEKLNIGTPVQYRSRAL
jgi:hypothetical protein